MHISNTKQASLTSSSSSSILNPQLHNNNTTPSNNLNKSLNLPTKSSGNVQQTSNPKPNISNGFVYTLFVYYLKSSGHF